MLGKGDAPPWQVKLCSVTLVLYLIDRAYNTDIPNLTQIAYADMICIVSFLLLYSVEYTGRTNNNAEFSLNDVCFCFGNKNLKLATVSELEMLAVV